MSQSLIDDFLAEVEGRVGALADADRHALARAAKLVRHDIEAGEGVPDEVWESLFPSPAVRVVARRVLEIQPSIMEMDFEKTVIGGHRPAAPASPPDASTDPGVGKAGAGVETVVLSPDALDKAWHALLISIPPEGLPADEDPSRRIESLLLGRMILDVSGGRAKVPWARIPTANGFRDRMVKLARAAGKTAYIEGAPEGG